ncbi:hypothetical protein KCU85_g9072, partial [Aureobasidium melanogenum]
MFSDTNIQNLETLLQKGIVCRPVNYFFIKRNYTDRELKTLKSLEPDASKAIGRQLSDTERNVLLEYKGNSIASESRPSAFTVSIAALGGVLSTMIMMRARRRRICGQLVHRIQDRHLSLRDFGGIASVTALLLKPTESQPLSLEILGDPRMSEFRRSIQCRKKEFGGHEPKLVRRMNRNTEEPIQWFRAASRSKYIASIKVSPPREIDREESLSITDYPDHPDLTWPEGSSSYRKQLRGNLIARENQILENMSWQEVLKVLELCNRAEPLDTFVYNPPAPIPRLYVK